MNRRRAFTLYEVIIALSMMVFAINFGTQLFRANMQVISHSNQIFNQSMQTDAALAELRRDVWSSQTITVTDSNAVKLTGPRDQQITWSLTPDGSIDRNDGSGLVRHWPLIAKDWTFTTNGPALIVSDAVSQGPRAVTLISQLLTAARQPT